MPDTIDITPNWNHTAGVCIMLLENGEPEGKDWAKREVIRMGNLLHSVHTNETGGIATIPTHGGNDPENMNDEREEWGADLLCRLEELTGTEPEDALSDALGYLMHVAHSRGQNFGKELNRACYHFTAETREG